MSNREQINLWISEACLSNNVPNLISQIVFKFSNKMVSCMGKAYYRQKLIKLSHSYFDNISIEEQRNTVIHETCHIIAHHLFPQQKIMPHGKEWKRCMRNAGLAAKRTHNFEIAKGVQVKCNCGERTITKNKATRMRNGTQYRCSKCNELIKF